MKVSLAQLLVISVTLNVVGLVIISDQASQIKRQKVNTTRLKNWGTVLSEIVIDQLDHNETFDMDPKVKANLEAYLLMRENGLA